MSTTDPRPVRRTGATARAPASTSNLGGGFDCVGVAVDRWLTVHARRVAPDLGGSGRGPSASPVGASTLGLEGNRQPAIATPVAGPALERRGTLSRLDEDPEVDLILVGFDAACRSAGVAPPAGLRFEADSEIPIGRGLGSSAAALVAGAALADHLLGLGLDDERLAAVCADVEGHPDNVAPAVYGGAVLAVRSPAGDLAVARLEVHTSLAFVLAVPDFPVSTKRARAVLPETVPHATAVAAAARGAALVQGLARADEAMLALAVDDVLHVPHRRGLVPGFDAVCAAAIAAGAFGATLSGSGSAVVAVAPVGRAPAIGEAMRDAWSSLGAVAEWFQSAGRVPGVSVSTAPPTSSGEARRPAR